MAVGTGWRGAIGCGLDLDEGLASRREGVHDRETALARHSVLSWLRQKPLADVSLGKPRARPDRPTRRIMILGFDGQDPSDR